MMEVMSSGTSSDEENKEHNVGNVSLEVVGQGIFFLRVGSLHG